MKNTTIREWDLYKAWCKIHNLKPSNGNNLLAFMKMKAN